MIKYKTEQRKILMNILIAKQNEFISAEEILDFMKKNNQEIGLTTIYRFLKHLEEDNDVIVENRNHTKYYQYIKKQNKQHLFLKCKNCGRSLDLDCKEIEDVNNHIKNEHKFNIDCNTIMYGICDKCSK